MRMLQLLGFLAITALPTMASGDTVGAREKSFTVKFKNGSSEIYVAKYRGKVNASKWETGHPARPLDGDLTDTRQCHWDIGTEIVRDLCLTSASGQQFCRSELTRVYGTSFSGKGSDFKVLDLAPENCGKANGRYESDVNNAQNAVLNSMDGVMKNDLAQVTSDLKGLPNVVSVQ